MSDLRFALRTFARTPALTVAAVLTLSVGIGATLAIAAVVYGVLLRPLPVADEDRLVVGYATRPKMDQFSDPISHPQYLEWKASGVFSDLAATTGASYDVRGGSATERVEAERVSTNFFAVIGARAALGRVLTPEDAVAIDVPAVISQALWQRQFASDPDAIGRPLRTPGRTFVIVGVMPPDFTRWRGNADVWVPIDQVIEPAVINARGYQLFRAIGRLPHGAAPDGAEARLAAVQRELDAERVRRRRDTDDAGVRLVNLRDDIVGPRAARIVTTAGAVAGLVWLVVCANIANVLIASTARRRGELFVRAAIGAGRARLMRQLFAEGAVLAAAGTAGGWFVAHAVVNGMLAHAPAGELDFAGVALDRRLALFGAGLGGATALLCGLLPAWRASRAAFDAGFGAFGRATADRRLTRASGLLMAGQIAVSVAVLVGASLLAQTLVALSRVQLGFESSGVHLVRASFGADRYGSPFRAGSRHAEAYATLTDRLRRLPGVRDVSVADGGFLRVDRRASIDFDDGRRLLNGDPRHRLIAPRLHSVGPGYFELLGIALRAGRTFTDRDVAGTRRVAVVNETLAALHWPGNNPVGRLVNFGNARGETDRANWVEIIGVVADARYGGVDEPMKPEIYQSILQSPYHDVVLLVRTGDDSGPAGALDVLRAVDAEMPVFPIRSLRDEIDESTAAVRYSAALLSSFAGIAVLLALVGLYALLANDVAARGRELAIRVAVGAAPSRVVRMVVARAAALLIPGLVAGIFGAWAMGRALGHLLFQTAPASAAAFGAAVLIMFAGTLAAVYTPARRASRVDPIVLLRAE